MEFLDLRTILINYALINLICASILITVWIQNRMRFRGLDYYAASFVANFFGITLLGLRNIILDFASILLGNLFLLGGVFFLFIGISNFLDKKINQIHNLIILAVYGALQALLIYLYPSINLRIILFSAVMTIYCLQMTWMIFSNKEKDTQSITRGLGVISILYWMIGIVRIVYTLIFPAGEELFRSSPFEISIYILFELVYIVLTFYLFLMVNRSLVLDLEKDIKQKKIVEIELQRSEEKFYKAFISSPVPMLISVLKDGTILDANDAFVALSGYRREEILSDTTLNLRVWDNPEDRKKLVKEIEKNGKLSDFHFLGRNKQRDVLHLVYSGEGIVVNNENCLISSLLNITNQYINNKITQLRLSLWEYSNDHTVIELMTKALDEIEIITNSKISFFHIVHEEKGELLLQAWSTRTKQSFCKAKGENTHYAVENAGVWADCVRTKKPLIHNDYNALKDKKGLPEGHAQVMRELVVPVIEKGKIEAVLGIGNKESEYTDQDIELVEDVAALVWVILRQKQADDQIMQLNDKLEELAMTDELTQIMNRRAFFIRGEEEIKRARRHHWPVTAIMLDIDRFKNINDSLGHDTGDYVLQCFALTLKNHIRGIDLLGRIGGEEFGILLPNTKADDAILLAERLRSSIETGNCMSDQIPINLTASFGVAEYHLDLKDLDDLLKEADIALYRAKESGRNKVILYTQVQG